MPAFSTVFPLPFMAGLCPTVPGHRVATVARPTLVRVLGPPASQRGQSGDILGCASCITNLAIRVQDARCEMSNARKLVGLRCRMRVGREHLAHQGRALGAGGPRLTPVPPSPAARVRSVRTRTCGSRVHDASNPGAPTTKKRARSSHGLAA